MKATINCLVTLHLRASYLCLCLGFCFDCDNVALEGVGHFFSKLAGEKRQGTQCLLKVQNQRSSRTLFWDCRSLPR